jgi:hypothetical protein
MHSQSVAGKKRLTTVPSWMEKDLQEIRELCDWYKRYKPTVQTLTVSRKVMDELEKRDIPEFTKTSNGIFFRGMVVKPKV